MNSSILGIFALLSLLFYCTCVCGDESQQTHHKAQHDAKNHHNLKHHYNHKHHGAKHKHNIHSRDNGNTTEHSTCSNPNDIQIFFNASNNVIGFFNPLGISSVIFNYSSSGIVIILNNQSRSIFVFNSSDSTPFQISNVSLQNQSFPNFFAYIASQGINGLANNSEIVNSALALPAAYIRTILNISRFFSQIGSFLNRFNFQSQCFQGSLTNFLQIFRTLISQFGSFPSGFERFIENSTNINLFPILNSPNALEGARQFMNIFGSINNIIPILRPYLNSSENFFIFIGQFELNMTMNNVNSFFGIISSVFCFSRRQCLGDNLFRTLLQAPNEPIGLNSSNLTTFLQTLNQLNNSADIQNWVTTIQNLTQNTLFVDNANITSFLTSLNNRSSAISSVNASIQDLANLSNLFNPIQLYTSYIRFVGNLIYNPRDFNLSRIFPGIDFQNPDIQNLLPNAQNITRLISGIPGLNIFFTSLITNINAANNISLSIPQIFTSNLNPLQLFGNFVQNGITIFEGIFGLGNQNNPSTTPVTEENDTIAETTGSSASNATSPTQSEEVTETTKNTVNDINNATTIDEETTSTLQSTQNDSTTKNGTTNQRHHHLKKHHSSKYAF